VTGNVIWRVRAERRMLGSDTRTLPAVSYGPWSRAYTAAIEPSGVSSLRTVRSAASSSSPTQQLPVFLYPSNRTQLSHVYVTTDVNCSNVVLNSGVVRGGAWVPRSASFAQGTRVPLPVNVGPLAASDGKPVVPSEAGTSQGARVDLPAGRYFWTVVPVERRSDGSFRDTRSVDAACDAARGTFVKTSARPAVGPPSTPYASGLSPLGKVVSTERERQRLYGNPLVAWRPALGATRYEVQWSRSENPWRTLGSLSTHSTSVSLPVAPGTWWYRVRGLNASIDGNPRMPWSAPARVRITVPTLAVVG
jgi:hypothetical protein